MTTASRWSKTGAQGQSLQHQVQSTSQHSALPPWCGVALTAGLLAVGSITAPAAYSADFTLIGSELRLRTIFQFNPSSQLLVTSFPAVATVSESAVEFPTAASLFDAAAAPPGFSLVNVAIDAGTDYLDIDFANAGFNRFATGFENTYVFTFADAIALQITEAQLDPLTTLGLTSDRVTFVNNELFVNVQSLRFTPDSFVRINLNGTLNPPPDPDPTPDPDPSPVSVPEPSVLALIVGAVMWGLGRNRQDNPQVS